MHFIDTLNSAVSMPKSFCAWDRGQGRFAGGEKKNKTGPEIPAHLYHKHCTFALRVQRPLKLYKHPTQDLKLQPSDNSMQNALIIY